MQRKGGTPEVPGKASLVIKWGGSWWIRICPWQAKQISATPICRISWLVIWGWGAEGTGRHFEADMGWVRKGLAWRILSPFLCLPEMKWTCPWWCLPWASRTPEALGKHSQVRLVVQGEDGRLQPLTESCWPYWGWKGHRPCQSWAGFMPTDFLKYWK